MSWVFVITAFPLALVTLVFLRNGERNRSLVRVVAQRRSNARRAR